MTREQRLRCAAESLVRSEPLLATASRVRRWLLVEQPGPWGREALLESRLDATVARTLRSKAKREGVRVLLIRRPDRSRAADDRRHAYLVRSDRAHRWLEELKVTDPTELERLDLAVLRSDAPPGVGEPGPASVHLVCTNGRHDPCCADLGRPVVRSLRDSGADVWESSHVGGDRFAANLVILPTGVYYGRVPPDGAGRLIREHAEGLIDLEHYRGRSCYTPLTQAAEIHLRHELAERRLDALQLASVRAEDDDTAAAVFTVEGRDYRVRVRRELGGREHLTCSDNGLSRPWRYRLLELATVDA